MFSGQVDSKALIKLKVNLETAFLLQPPMASELSTLRQHSVYIFHTAQVPGCIKIKPWK